MVDFDGLNMIDFILFLSNPSEAFQMGFLVLTLVYPKPWLCHPTKGCDFWLLLWDSFNYVSIPWCLGWQEDYTYWSPSYYSSIWQGFRACEFSTTLDTTYWIDMGPRVFPPNMSHELMFQTSAQSDEAIQSYPYVNGGYQNGALIVTRVNVL